MTGSRSVMGEFVNLLLLSALAILISTIVISMNSYLDLGDVHGRLRPSPVDCRQSPRWRARPTMARPPAGQAALQPTRPAGQVTNMTANNGSGLVSDFADGQRVLLEVNGREVFVFEREGRFHAFENMCPHMGGPVGEGILMERWRLSWARTAPTSRERFSTTEIHLVCPWHGWEYDIETGECAALRRMRLRRFEAVQRGEMSMSSAEAAAAKATAAGSDAGPGCPRILERARASAS